ncbi:MAG: hypothetical protein FWG11_03955, partial [Promicromonosporaceae bacterium]|nr:hypothetical protein [Promicromonosporaceae bacterium]
TSTREVFAPLASGTSVADPVGQGADYFVAYRVVDPNGLYAPGDLHAYDAVHGGLSLDLYFEISGVEWDDAESANDGTDPAVLDDVTTNNAATLAYDVDVYLDWEVDWTGLVPAHTLDYFWSLAHSVTGADETALDWGALGNEQYASPGQGADFDYTTTVSVGRLERWSFTCDSTITLTNPNVVSKSLAGTQVLINDSEWVVLESATATAITPGGQYVLAPGWCTGGAPSTAGTESLPYWEQVKTAAHTAMPPALAGVIVELVHPHVADASHADAFGSVCTGEAYPAPCDDGGSPTRSDAQATLSGSAALLAQLGTMLPLPGVSISGFTATLDAEARVGSPLTIAWRQHRGAGEPGFGYTELDDVAAELQLEGSTYLFGATITLAPVAATAIDMRADALVTTGRSLLVDKTLEATLERTYSDWTVTQTPINGTRLEGGIDGKAAFGVTVTAIPETFTDDFWTIQGEIEIGNPNPWPVGANLTYALNLGTTNCAFTDAAGDPFEADGEQVVTVPGTHGDDDNVVVVGFACQWEGAEPSGFTGDSEATIGWDPLEARSNLCMTPWCTDSKPIAFGYLDWQEVAHNGTVEIFRTAGVGSGGSLGTVTASVEFEDGEISYLPGKATILATTATPGAYAVTLTAPHAGTPYDGLGLASNETVDTQDVGLSGPGNAAAEDPLTLTVFDRPPYRPDTAITAGGAYRVWFDWQVEKSVMAGVQDEAQETVARTGVDVTQLATPGDGAYFDYRVSVTPTPTYSDVEVLGSIHLTNQAATPLAQAFIKVAVSKADLGIDHLPGTITRVTVEDCNGGSPCALGALAAGAPVPPLASVLIEFAADVRVFDTDWSPDDDEALLVEVSLTGRTPASPSLTVDLAEVYDNRTSDYGLARLRDTFAEFGPDSSVSTDFVLFDADALLCLPDYVAYEAAACTPASPLSTYTARRGDSLSAGEVGTYPNTATITPLDWEGTEAPARAASDEATVRVETGQDLTVAVTKAQPTLNRQFNWSLTQGVTPGRELEMDGAMEGDEAGEGEFTLDTTVGIDSWEDSAQAISGEITVQNPNLWPVDVTVTPIYHLGGFVVAPTCVYTVGGPPLASLADLPLPAATEVGDAVVPGAIVIAYDCTYPAPLGYFGSVDVTAVWDEAQAHSEGASADAGRYDFTDESSGGGDWDGTGYRDTNRVIFDGDWQVSAADYWVSTFHYAVDEFAAPLPDPVRLRVDRPNADGTVTRVSGVDEYALTVTAPHEGAPFDPAGVTTFAATAYLRGDSAVLHTVSDDLSVKDRPPLSASNLTSGGAYLDRFTWGLTHEPTPAAAQVKPGTDHPFSQEIVVTPTAHPEPVIVSGTVELHNPARTGLERQYYDVLVDGATAANAASVTALVVIDCGGTPAPACVVGPLAASAPIPPRATVTASFEYEVSDWDEYPRAPRTVDVAVSLTGTAVTPPTGTVECTAQPCSGELTRTTQDATATLAGDFIEFGAMTPAYSPAHLDADAVLAAAGHVTYTYSAPRGATVPDGTGQPDGMSPTVGGEAYTYTNTVALTPEDSAVAAEYPSAMQVKAGLPLEASVDRSRQSLTRTFGDWAVEPSVPAAVQEGDAAGAATFPVTLTVTPGSLTDSLWRLSGIILIENPNHWVDMPGQDWDVVAEVSFVPGLDLADTAGTAAAASCQLTSLAAASTPEPGEPIEVLVPAGSAVIVSYDCAYLEQPVYVGANQVVVEWSSATAHTTTGQVQAPAPVTVSGWEVTALNAEVDVWHENGVDPGFGTPSLQRVGTHVATADPTDAGDTTLLPATFAPASVPTTDPLTAPLAVVMTAPGQGEPGSGSTSARQAARLLAGDTDLTSNAPEGTNELVLTVVDRPPLVAGALAVGATYHEDFDWQASKAVDKDTFLTEPHADKFGVFDYTVVVTPRRDEEAVVAAGGLSVSNPAETALPLAHVTVEITDGATTWTVPDASLTITGGLESVDWQLVGGQPHVLPGGAVTVAFAQSLATISTLAGDLTVTVRVFAYDDTEPTVPSPATVTLAAIQAARTTSDRYATLADEFAGGVEATYRPETLGRSVATGAAAAWGDDPDGFTLTGLDAVAILAGEDGFLTVTYSVELGSEIVTESDFTDYQNTVTVTPSGAAGAPAGWTEEGSPNPQSAYGPLAATQTVRVLTGHDLLVTETGPTPTLQRRYTWGLAQAVQDGDYSTRVNDSRYLREGIETGGASTFDIDVTVTSTHTDEDWQLSGVITVENPNPWDVWLTAAHLTDYAASSCTLTDLG